MRRSLALLAVLPSLALAAPKPKPIDVKPVIDKLDVFKDDIGNYYVSPRADAMAFDAAQAWVFYGDGKTLYQQRIIGSSLTSGHHFTWNVWAPRVKGMQSALLSLDPDGLVVQCRQRDEGKRTLTQLPAPEAHTLLAKAALYPPLWQRQAHVLLRDDDGIYYYVDELRDEFGGNGYRVFVGAKGAMKELAMTNVASDSAGELFATKSGQLKLIAGSDGKAFWIKGGRGGTKTELTRLDPQENRYLIYRELGIYGTLGAICDEQ